MGLVMDFASLVDKARIVRCSLKQVYLELDIDRLIDD